MQLFGEKTKVVGYGNFEVGKKKEVEDGEIGG